MTDRTRAREALLLQLLLAIGVLAVFSRSLSFGFVQYDDPTYVTENPHVLAGLSWDGLRWAFTTTTAGNWHPLTWLSLMLDATLGGGAAWTFHATSLLLHLLNTLLLFRFLSRATGSPAPSAFVAALFAVHPLHVESVVWIAERKDVLSTFFGFLALHAYVGHAGTPGIRSRILVLAAFAASLLAKPMGVTLPIVMLLLDLWPLGRRDFGRLLLEKLPLFALSAASSAVTIFAQSRGGALGSFETLPLATRAANAVVVCATYLSKTVWPQGLALPYPYDLSRLVAWRILAASGVLVAITFAALRGIKSRPFFTVGWLWYLVTLLPVIGLVQVGAQSMADRYTYLPLVGIFLVIAWGGRELVAGRSAIAAAAAAVLVTAALGARAYAQVGVWRDTQTLFENAVRVTGPNAVAEGGLALVLHGEGRIDEAIEHYRGALRASPRYVEARINLAAALIAAGRPGESARECEAVLADRSEDPRGHACLGAALLNQGRTEEAAKHLAEAVLRAPETFSARVNLASALLAGNDEEGALGQLAEAARLRPADAGVQVTTGTVLLRRGDLDGAADRFIRALALEPANLAALRNLGVLRARQGRIGDAIAYFEEALRHDPADEATRRNLERARALPR